MKKNKYIHKAKKSLGQNFLQNKSVIFDILKTADISPEDTVLEIGPGKGILTEGLLTKTKKVLAVEKDDTLYEKLNQKFFEDIKEGYLKLAHGDILDQDFSELGEYKIVANIPYNITGEIIRKFLTTKNKPKSITLLVQKEVAERIVARDGKESVLSISVKVYGQPKYIKKVGSRNFRPQPKVDSAILHISGISNIFFKKEDNRYINESDFFRLVKIGFSQKRKKLSNNIKSMLLVSPSIVFKDLGFNENIRAEELSPKDWKKIFDYCQFD
jgi:16S rRNA (adenine1518-N6/adenine1519-N6)-dimethyltransferase